MGTEVAIAHGKRFISFLPSFRYNGDSSCNAVSEGGETGLELVPRGHAA